MKRRADEIRERRKFLDTLYPLKPMTDGMTTQQVAEVMDHNNLMRRLRAEDDARERQRKQDQLFDEVHEMRRLLEQQK